MYVQNYYLKPFIIEFFLGCVVLYFRHYLLLGDKIGILTGVSIILLSFTRFYKYLEKSSLIKQMSKNSSLTVSLKKGKIPKDKVFIGKGFVWQNDHVQKMYDLKSMNRLDGLLNPNSDGLSLIHGIGKKEEKNIYLPVEELNTHTAIVGTTGVGKTRALELFIGQAILQNEPVVVIDPKGDNQLVDRVYDLCIKAGRKNDFMFFSLAHPKSSSTYNPLENFSKPTDIASRIRSIMDIGEEPFYADFAWNLILGITSALLSLDEKPTIRSIHRYSLIDFEELMTKFTKRYNEAKMSNDEAIVTKLEPALKYLKKIESHPRDHFAKVTASLEPVLASLSHGEIGDLLSTIPSDITFEKVINKNKVVYFYLSSMIDNQVARNVGRMALQDLLFYVGSIYAHYPDVEFPLNVFVDEFYNVIFDGYVDLLNKARGAGVRVTLAMQTSKDVESVVSEPKAMQILANTNNKIFFRVPEIEVAKLFSEMFGKTVIKERMKTISVSPDVGDNGIYYGTNSGERLLNKEVDLIEPQLLTSLPKGEVFMYTQGRLPYKVRMPLISDKIENRFMEKVIESNRGLEYV
ncbi:DUF87 domain-containing protein [Deferribacter autotrophicus]|uniref:DUF87 domain-containing protein n=2 Tax=Deferribacter autotrophicus TaxID=500465 RepID=A0A5A8F4M9_9BACT|nr:DUF87 domain-containing protein [Deferribacter autotrophicus]